ncbi:MAG: DinB family protein [Bacteroidetes bacterium]|nr:MAG: DinB family protein [Bacteroidota bacterium]
MTFHKKALIISTIFYFSFMSICIGQQSPSFSSAIERQFDKIESDIISSAKAMPEEKFFFTPENLHIKNSDLKGVRTFAGQIMHLATDNILIWSAITGDSVRADIVDVNGPKSITTRDDVLKYLKSSFDEGRKAISMVTEKNAMHMIEFRGRNLPMLDLAFYALTHANEHYGQMVVYLRMCGIVPPPTLNER